MRALTMHLPGHTPGTTALLVGERLLLVGDTVFVRGLGRPDLTGQAEDLARSLFRSVHDRLEPLSPETVIAPAHWSSPAEFNDAGHVTTTLRQVFEATLLNEQAIERFVQEIVSTLPEAPEAYDTIRLVNAGPAEALRGRARRARRRPQPVRCRHHAVVSTEQTSRRPPW